MADSISMLGAERRGSPYDNGGAHTARDNH